MKPSNTMWGRVLACCLAVTGTLGFWAGSAAAQTSESGSWFDDSAPPPAGAPDGAASSPDYSPPPADFQTPPAAEPSPSASASSAEEAAPEDDPAAQERALQEFSPRLEPYGRWVDDPWYGRIWVPSRAVVGSEFVPYSTAGHWELTPEDAWLWASDYPFGWITFHYGRWVWASTGVWAWVPGYAYAPAWVDFHVGAIGYIGWAPLAPSFVWRNGVFLSVGVYHPAPVVYCPTRYVFIRSMPRHVVRDHARVRSISAQTHVYRPRYRSHQGLHYVARGPSPAEAHIPASALPSRRVIARPRLGAFSGARQTRIESFRSPSPRKQRSDRVYSSGRGHISLQGDPPRRSYRYDRGRPSSRAPAVRPHSYGGYRAPALPQRAPSPQRSWRGAPAQRRFAPGPAQRAQPNRRAPAAVPGQSRGYRAPYGFQRGSVPPRAAQPQGAKRDSRGGRQRDGNASSGDARVRGRAPQHYGSWH